MNFKSRFGLAAALVLAVGAVLPAVSAEDKQQKITFIEDDAQSYYATKIYTLKHVKAVDIAPFVRTAVQRCKVYSNVSIVSDGANKREMLIVNTKEGMFPYVDEMIAALDRPGKRDANGSVIDGTGIDYGVYKPKFRSSPEMRDIMEEVGITNGPANSVIAYDYNSGMIFFKDTPSGVAGIKEKLSWLDVGGPQATIELNVYEVRDSDLRDIGIDYLAWKNGPGLNLFEAGYQALSVKATEMIIQQFAERGVDLLGSFGPGYSCMFTAPAFDMSFIRILQQNGKATINSSASIVVCNGAGKTFTTSFAPQYQNIMKDKDHRASVGIGKDASLTLDIDKVIITDGKNGVVNFRYLLTSDNVVERNNLGAELSDGTYTSSALSLDYKTEKVIMSWNRTARVDQTIGIPFLCELPVLRYIFGTTTTNIETIRYFVTAKAVATGSNVKMTPGIVSDFDELVKK